MLRFDETHCKIQRIQRIQEIQVIHNRRCRSACSERKMMRVTQSMCRDGIGGECQA